MKESKDTLELMRTSSSCMCLIGSILEDVRDLQKQLWPLVRAAHVPAWDLENLGPHISEVGQQVPNSICKLPMHLVPAPIYGA